MCHNCFKPKFHYSDFHRNFSAGKVVDTNHESRRQKTILTCQDVCDSLWQICICFALMEFSPLQCTGKVSDKVRKRWSWPTADFVVVTDTNHESPQHKPWKSATRFVSRSFMICVHDKICDCRGLCHKVSVLVMAEFGLYTDWAFFQTVWNN